MAAIGQVAGSSSIEESLRALLGNREASQSYTRAAPRS
jgi:hypothetical protein